MSTTTTTTDDGTESGTENESNSTENARVIGYQIERLDSDEKEQAAEDDREPEWENAAGVYNYRRNAEDRADELEAKRESTEYRVTEVSD